MSSLFNILVIIFLGLLFQHTQSSTVVVDGVSEWNNPTAHVGDTIIFRHKYRYQLYIFQNERAFTLCNFTQATLLTSPSTPTYTWHPSRTGFFYFGFYNGSVSTCQQDSSTNKLAIKVVSSAASPPLEAHNPPGSSAPAPTSGGAVASSPAFPWPFQPREELSPTPSPGGGAANAPSVVPDKGGSIPFINSNPAVPLPTGEVDTTTIMPLPTSADGPQVLVGLVPVETAISSLIFLLTLL